MKATSDGGFLDTLGVRPAQFNGGRAYIAYPNLAGVRWLLPADPLLRTVGLQFYAPQRLRGRLLKRAMASGALRGQRVWVDGTALDELGLALGQWVGYAQARLAFSLGTPGAYRKATAQLIGAERNILAYAKIAVGPLAQEALDAEWRNLQRVSAVAPRGHVPDPLHVGTWRGAGILLISPGPARPGPQELGRAHFDFLQALHFATRQECEFGSSAMFSRLREDITRWGRVWPDPWPRRLARALSRLESELGTQRIPLSFAHRDFAPWNTRSGPAGLFVFDWESGLDGVVPLYDAFHFGAIQSATWNALGRRGNSFIEHLLATLWPAGEERLSALYLAYLVDVSLLYGEARARAPEAGEERVWRGFGSRIDECLAAAPQVT